MSKTQPPLARRKASNRPPKWTIMIYLAGDGNLTAHCINVLQQLETVDYRDDVHLLACFDSNTPAAKGSRYLEISRKRLSVDNGFNWELHDDLIPTEERDHTIQAPNFCDPNPRKPGRPESRTGPVAAEGVRRFINWAMENHEAERYMLIFMGHGPIVASQTFLAKENPPSSLLLTDLKKVLGEHFGPKANRKLSILACNNCVMNGIETAVEVRELVDFMIGSQGLMLAAGWPYQKVIGAVVDDPDAPTAALARKMLAACARNLLDFTLMDRSSEQSVCDLTKLGEKDNIVGAIRNLSEALKQGLEFKIDEDGKRVLRYPAICDAVKLARLEAQTYWSEMFVDIYDFCERLLKKCDDVALVHSNLLQDLGFAENCTPKKFRSAELINRLTEIIECCIKAQEQVKLMVPESYYIGAELQYSHGLSIYFPWTRPERPYFFERMSQGRDYRLRTPFETYRRYDFAQLSGWSLFLEDFFRATLRNVRRLDRTFETRGETDSLDLGLVGQNFTQGTEMLAINLQKSSSDTGPNEPESWSTIKNYPRRNYLSPTDCPRKIDEAGTIKRGSRGVFQDPKQPPVSYLGWNISGLLAEVMTPRKGAKRKPKSKPKATPKASRTKRASRP